MKTFGALFYSACNLSRGVLNFAVNQTFLFPTSDLVEFRIAEIKINEQRLCQILIRFQDAQKRSNWAGRADRIYWINWIEGPSAQGHLAAGGKILLIL